MELKEYYRIIKTHISVVIYAALIFIVAAYAWSVKKSETYSASLLLNITRAESQSTADYRFDQFYRLQADEKFAETLEQWLKSPGVAQDIFTKADVKTGKKSLRLLGKSFRAEKVAPNIVEVTYGTASNEEAKKIADAIGAITVEKTKNLNREARDPNWFQVDATNFIAAKNTQDFGINLAVAALAGIFFGGLLALGKHYISE